MASCVWRNCYDNLPVNFKIDLPDNIQQSVTQPLTVEVKALIRNRKVLKAPFTLVIDVRKEWYEDFYSSVPCFNFGVENCRIKVTPKMIRNAGYHYPIRRKFLHVKQNFNFQSIPDYLLEGKYKINLVLWTHTPHKSLLACVRGNFTINVKH